MFRSFPVLAILVRLLVGVGAAWVAVGFYRMWEAAVRNSASPGAIVLLFLAGVAALVALLSAVAVVVQFLRRE